MIKKIVSLLLLTVIASLLYASPIAPKIYDVPTEGSFPLVSKSNVANIYCDADDYKVVDITTNMLSEDVERVTGRKPRVLNVKDWHEIHRSAAIVAGTIGKSVLISQLINKCKINVNDLKGKWESYMLITTTHPKYHTPLLLVIGSDRRGTAYGLTTLCEAIGVSPWYWWADVTPKQKDFLYIEPGTFKQGEPQVQYRGIFINDERFGGWARWAEQTYDAESGKVGPKTYKQVFELLLRLKANYLWPAMHPGTQAFNADPENARLADDYAIVMGSSHCEQMLRNNEGEWKAVGTYGDFNYITNRQTMLNYWEERVKTNGKYENTYTLGLRGIHDYPMEGANTTEERVKLMQQAINDQRNMLRRNIDKPIEDIPQVLCTYEEVLDAYHNGLKIPDEVTLLWSDDKQGYCRNLCNPEEMKRKGGAGIYYHLSYHGDPASWLWLSPLSPAFLSTELTKAYTFGARKIWVFNVGDIKPAEKEISFVMDLAWDLDQWSPSKAHDYIRYWAAKTFGESVAYKIADLQNRYYQLQAGGKDAHVWFINFTEQQILQRIQEWRDLAEQVNTLEQQIPEELKDAYFELIAYPICGAGMLNEYQLLARRSMAEATSGDNVQAMEDANRVQSLFNDLNEWTHHYNEGILDGKWKNFFNWQPYHWFRSERIDPPICTTELLQQISKSPSPRFVDVQKALSIEGCTIESEVDGEIPLWIEALSPVRNFSKEPADNVFCHVSSDRDSFEASATPINNVWHSPLIGPMWSKVGIIHLKKGINRLNISDLKPEARIDRIYLGAWVPFDAEPRVRIPAYNYSTKHDSNEGQILRIEQLGYSDGVIVQPFNTHSYTIENLVNAPFVEYELDLHEGDSYIEIRTLPTLHVYEGRDARYAIQLDNDSPMIYSIHANDFTSEWRLNVLRGYASRRLKIPASNTGRKKLKVYFLDPGIVLQEVLIY